jgi:hypothetical protein
VGGLDAAARLWRPGLPTASPVDSFPELAALIARELAHSVHRSATSLAIGPEAVGPPDHSSASDGQISPGEVGSIPGPDSPRAVDVTNDLFRTVAARNRIATVVGIAWVCLALYHTFSTVADWPNRIDGVLIARLEVFGSVALIVSGFVVLPALWRALRATPGVRAGLTRVLAAFAAFCVLIVALTLSVNARSEIRIAFGNDPMRQPLIVSTQDGQVEVRGPLAAGAAKTVADWIAVHPTTIIYLNSPGGWIREGTLLADVIREHSLATYSRTGCYSACATAFLAGSTRSIHPEARLGFHSTSGVGIDPFYLLQMNQTFAAQLRALGAHEDFVTKVLSTPAADMWMPGPAALVENHLVDKVVADGFADSGEPLHEFDPRVAEFASRYAFVNRLGLVDPARRAELDRSIRLALRRHAEPEANALAAQLANEIEISRLPRVSDEVAHMTLRSLLAASTEFLATDANQCVAIWGWSSAAMANRSGPAVEAIAGVEDQLLAAETSLRPATEEASMAALMEVARRARKLNPSALQVVLRPDEATPDAVCRAYSWLATVALSADVSTAAGFVRALRVYGSNGG